MRLCICMDVMDIMETMQPSSIHHQQACFSFSRMHAALELCLTSDVSV